MTIGDVHLDGVTVGVLLYTVLALLGCPKLGIKPPGTLLVASVGWVGWLLVHNHRAGMAATALAILAAFKRYGWRHTLGTVAVTLLYSTLLWNRIAAHGANVAAAFADATIRMIFLVFWCVVAWIVYQTLSRKVDAWFGRGLAAETYRLHETAEHKRAMGLGRKGLGWAKTRARQAVTRRGGPEPKTIEGPPPKQLPAGRGRDRRGRFTAGQRPAAHHPAQPTDGYGIAPPYFKREPWWRWR